MTTVFDANGLIGTSVHFVARFFFGTSSKAVDNVILLREKNQVLIQMEACCCHRCADDSELEEIRADVERRPNAILRVGHGDQNDAPVPCCRNYSRQFCMARKRQIDAPSPDFRVSCRVIVEHSGGSSTPPSGSAPGSSHVGE